MKIKFSPFKWLGRIFPFNWIGDLIRFSFSMLFKGIKKVQESIRLQLIVTFVICLLVSVFVYALSTTFFGQYNKFARIDYTQGKKDIESEARYIADRMQHRETEEEVLHVIRDTMQYSPYKILILSLEGQVLYKSSNATETHVDVHHLISNAMNDRIYYDNSPREFITFFPIDLISEKAYLVVSGIPNAQIDYIPGSSPIPMIAAVAAFILLFYWLTKRKMKDVEELAQGLLEISKGNLEYRVPHKSSDELGSLASNINHMVGELQRTIEEERLAERTKNELITNVSHDLRTPLTLIIGYLRLLKDKNYEDERQAETYLSIASSKSEKLKGLIDDLFEYTKLSNQGVRLTKETVCLNELIEQLLEETISYAEENELALKRQLPAERLMVNIDADQMIRVFENLLTNAIKYSTKPGTVSVHLSKEQGNARVCIINNGDSIPRNELDKLFERFYRIDASRTSATGGSGLGLAIAKSIIDTHGGEIWAESEGDEIRFCVRLELA
ncbi:cell wall metabolism sensor histidine kinase WalK [Paenibacillus sp. J2TS4]|uniref:sensor histidine kinase n=1 Tax=Paenibacillus sp. J2TS4 TaxID=2807194 RepID=UPI001B281EE4|nr:ATP-binding protein [Paenibacillus sp. J2TS4]GIP31210.1 two-component sensor histidine kinase [Paenibacillus sp. J2TS4]